MAVLIPRNVPTVPSPVLLATYAPLHFLNEYSVEEAKLIPESLSRAVGLAESHRPGVKVGGGHLSKQEQQGQGQLS